MMIDTRPNIKSTPISSGRGRGNSNYRRGGGGGVPHRPAPVSHHTSGFAAGRGARAPQTQMRPYSEVVGFYDPTTMKEGVLIFESNNTASYYIKEGDDGFVTERFDRSQKLIDIPKNRSHFNALRLATRVRDGRLFLRHASVDVARRALIEAGLKSEEPAASDAKAPDQTGDVDDMTPERESEEEETQP